MVVALVMGSMIGSGVFLLPASLASYGGLSLAGWVVSAGGAVCLALVFAHLARLQPAAGGPYAYTRRAFGDLAAFLVAWGYWISVWCSMAALVVAGVANLDPLIPGVVRTPVLAMLTAMAVLWGLTILNSVSLRGSGHVQVLTTIVKVLPLVLVGVGGLFYFSPEAFAAPVSGTREVVGAVAATSTLTLFAFLGLEAATIPAGAIDNPGRTIPRATVVGTLATAVVYIISTIGVMSLVPTEQLAQSTAPFADAAQTLIGPMASKLVAVIIAISCFGALNGWILISGQVTLAMARDNLFPAAFAKVTPQGMPVIGMVVASVLASILFATNYTRGLVDLYTFMILLSTLASLVPFSFCAMAAFLLDPNMSSGLRVAGGVAFLYAMFSIVGAGAETVYWGFLLLISGLPVYVWVKRST